jgi:tetratricopeptide (TPR) repeat protein
LLLAIVCAVAVAGFVRVAGLGRNHGPGQVSLELESREPQPVQESDNPSPAPRADEKFEADPVPQPPVAPPRDGHGVHARSDLVPPNPVADTQVAIEALKQESLAVANHLLEDCPGELDALGLMGNVQCHYGNTARGTECWEQCLRRDPSRVGFYDALAAVALRKADDEKAAQWCRQGLAQNPNAPHLHGRLGEALTALGRPEEAVPELQQETRISPANAEAHFLLGQAYSLLHEHQKAKSSFETAVMLDARQFKYEIKYHRALANACAKLGLDDEARQYRVSLRQMSDRAPLYDDLLNARQAAATTCGDAAAVYRNRGMISKAEELLRRAAALDAEKTDYRTRLAYIFLETGRESKAAEACRELIELEPNNAHHHVHLGFVCARMKQFDDARKLAQRALELSPDDPLCREFHEQMERAPR